MFVKGVFVERSLCILLPVENRESTLAAMVMELLEIASDLASYVELVIVDGGSNSHALEDLKMLGLCEGKLTAEGFVDDGFRQGVIGTLLGRGGPSEDGVVIVSGSGENGL